MQIIREGRVEISDYKRSASHNLSGEEMPVAEILHIKLWVAFLG